MADDFAKSIIRKHLAQSSKLGSASDYLNQFGQLQADDSALNFQSTAHNPYGLISQGIGNLINVAYAGENRANAARQEQIAAEETLYQRGQDAERNRRADARLALDQAVGDRAKEKDATQRNNANFGLKVQQELDGLYQQLAPHRDLLAKGAQQGWLQADASGNLLDLATDDKGNFLASAEFVEAFKKVPNVSAQLKAKQDELNKQILMLNADDNRLNDVTYDVGTGVNDRWTTLTSGNAEQMANLAAREASIGLNRDALVRQAFDQAKYTPTAQAQTFTNDLLSVNGDLTQLKQDPVDAWISGLPEDVQDDVRKELNGVLNSMKNSVLDKADGFNELESVEQRYVLAQMARDMYGTASWLKPGAFSDDAMGNAGGAYVDAFKHAKKANEFVSAAELKASNDIATQRMLYSAMNGNANLRRGGF